MKRFLIFILALATIASATAAEAPVTQAEASAVFVKAERVMKAILRYKGQVPAFPSGKVPATRTQVLQHFLSLYNAMAPKFKFTPPNQKSVATIISLRDPAAKKMAERLEILGCIDCYGPLATSKIDGLQPSEFGDALGYFMLRIADLTHTPTAKFSPFLMHG